MIILKPSLARMNRLLGLIALLSAAVACRSAQPPERQPVKAAPAPTAARPAETPAADLVDHLGDSPPTAAVVPADAPGGGVRFEMEWIFDRYGRFRKLSAGTGTQQGRRYDVIRVELADHSERTVYFDITDNWNRWTPARP
jgi:hypothetical protein